MLWLQASDLLSDKLGGPSVFPPQPPGITSEGTYGPLAWKVSEGEDRFRARGLYTFAKRTAPYAMFNTFDGPSGEACVARREVSNTPLQALTLLNDTVFVEAAAGDRATNRRQSRHHRRANRRHLPPLHVASAERSRAANSMAMFYAKQLARLAAGEARSQRTIAGVSADAKGMADVKPTEESQAAADAALHERAVWTLVARAVFNLDEVITKE